MTAPAAVSTVIFRTYRMLTAFCHLLRHCRNHVIPLHLVIESMLEDNTKL